MTIITGERGGTFTPASSKPLLGDALESFLTSHGVTKEWWTEFKEKYGMPPTCHCEDRQEWLNKTATAHPTVANIGVKLLNALKRKTT